MNYSFPMNLADLPSHITESGKTKSSTGQVFEDFLNTMDNPVLQVRCKGNPGFLKIIDADTAYNAHEKLYAMKRKHGATKPNYTSRGENPKKPLPEGVAPRYKANKDYVISILGEDNGMTDKKIEYAFNEAELLSQMKNYIDSTYDAHYSQGKYQATQIIEDTGHGMGFALGNVLKYCQRYGKKAGYNRADLMKVIHYGIIALAMHDREQADNNPYPSASDYPLDGQD